MPETVEDERPERPSTPSVSPVDEDAERQKQTNADLAHELMCEAHDACGVYHTSAASKIRAILDSRDAALREAREERDRLRATVADLVALPAADDGLWQHEIRGTTYRMLGIGRVQCPHDKPLHDDELPLVYQDIDSGALNIRRSPEFHDGRFKRVARSQPATPSPVQQPPADPNTWTYGMPRCDFCDNGLNSDWAFCPYCSRVVDASMAVERAPQDIGSSVMTDISGRQQPSAERDVLPDCMMPDGAEPCGGYTRLYEKNKLLEEAVQFAHGWIAGLPKEPSFEDKRAAQAALEVTGAIWADRRVSSPAAITTCQDTVDVTDEPKQHSSVRADDHEVGQPSPEPEMGAACRNAEGRLGTWQFNPVDGWVCVTEPLPTAAVEEPKSPDYLRGEREGLERAAQHVESNDCYTTDFGAGKALADEIRALLPPSTPETKP